MCIFGGLSNKSIGREMACKFNLVELEMEVSTPEDLGDRWGQAVVLSHMSPSCPSWRPPVVDSARLSLTAKAAFLEFF